MILIGLGLAACDQAQENRAAEQAAEAVREGNQALRTLGEKAREGTEKAADAARELGGTLSDATITARVKAALLAEQAVDGSRVEVETRDGVVTLSGSLRDTTEVERAIEIAHSTEGVKSVQSRLSAAS